MSIFEDKKFEKLDWMTQMTETIESNLNLTLSRLPAEISIGIEDLKTMMKDSYYSNYFSVRPIVLNLIRSTAEDLNLSYDDEQKIIDCFELKLDEETVVDFTNNTISKPMFVIKIKPTFEDAELQTFLGYRGLSHIRSSFFGPEHLNRLDEILSILEVEEKSKSVKKKTKALTKKMQDIFKNNEWRIRDMELADKISVWINRYILKGCLASLTNLCKLKVMTHNNMPIYSIQEEPIV